MKKEYAVLKVHLSETVPAYEFSRLTSLLNDVYDNFLWIEEIRKRGNLPYTFTPDANDRLYILMADIKKSNTMAFLGVGEHLIKTVTYLGDNFNAALHLEKVSILELNMDNGLADLIQHLKSDSVQPKLQQVDAKSIIKKPRPSLESELDDLKQKYDLDDELHEEKSFFIDYLKNISLVTENIINTAELTLIHFP